MPPIDQFCFCQCCGTNLHRYFLEKNMLALMMRYLGQPEIAVQRQLIQTLGIMMSNMSDPLSLCEHNATNQPINQSINQLINQCVNACDILRYLLQFISRNQTDTLLSLVLPLHSRHLFIPDYLLSNNYINDLIVFPFNFSGDDELLAHYVTFVKAIALRLDSNTLQFFFNRVSKQAQSYLAWAPN
jgi:hypothetical protein